MYTYNFKYFVKNNNLKYVAVIWCTQRGRSATLFNFPTVETY